MQVGILKTDGGPHSPEDWAVATADRIMDMIDVDQNSPRKAGLLSAKRAFETKCIEILERAHGQVQDHEKRQLQGDENRLGAPVNSAEHVEQPFDAILKATEGSMLENHFRKQEIQDELKFLLWQHFNTAVDIERMWHAHRALQKDPSHKLANVYQMAREAHGPGDLHHHFQRYTQR